MALAHSRLLVNVRWLNGWVFFVNKRPRPQLRLKGGGVGESDYYLEQLWRRMGPAGDEEQVQDFLVTLGGLLSKEPSGGSAVRQGGACRESRWGFVM